VASRTRPPRESKARRIARHMTIRADITLIQNSTAGNPDKHHTDQTITIQRKPQTVRTSVDGKVATADHETTIVWREGSPKDLKSITDVKIFKRGSLELEGAIITTYRIPEPFEGGVRFDVFEAGKR